MNSPPRFQLRHVTGAMASAAPRRTNHARRRANAARTATITSDVAVTIDASPARTPDPPQSQVLRRGLSLARSAAGTAASWRAIVRVGVRSSPSK